MRSIVGREFYRVLPTRVKIPDESSYHATQSLLKCKLIGLKTNNNFNSVNFLFIMFKIALQNANVEIVDVEIICIEMKWQRVCVIIKATSSISASFSNGMRFGVFFALN